MKRNADIGLFTKPSSIGKVDLVKVIECQQPETWDRYVAGHPHGSVFHLFGWKRIFGRVYGLAGYHLMAVDDPADHNGQPDGEHSSVRGICALFFLRSPLNRRRLIASPYLDAGGILADDADTECLLLQKAIELARNTHAHWIELRQTVPLADISDSPRPSESWGKDLPKLQVSNHKASLQRTLPADSATLMHAFKSKLRSQIRKAMKNGLSHTIGGIELLPDFYNVFSHNMRDLGSPVHSGHLFERVLDTFGPRARIVLVRKGPKAVAGSIVLRFKHRLHNPWASSLRAYRHLGTNMLLYWTMLAHACDTGSTIFDFGRSSPGAGTFLFKRQWGAEPTPLYWYYLTLEGDPVDPLAEHLSFRLWKRLPVCLSRVIGPKFRRHIGL